MFFFLKFFIFSDFKILIPKFNNSLSSGLGTLINVKNPLNKFGIKLFEMKIK